MRNLIFLSCFIGASLVFGTDNSAFQPNEAEKVTVDSSLIVVVGKVLAGERFRISRIQGNFASLEKEDGTSVPGWIQLKYLRSAQ